MVGEFTVAYSCPVEDDVASILRQIIENPQDDAAPVASNTVRIVQCMDEAEIVFVDAEELFSPNESASPCTAFGDCTVVVVADGDRHARDVISAGAADYIVRPLDVGTVRLALHRAVDEAQRRRAYAMVRNGFASAISGDGTDSTPPFFNEKQPSDEGSSEEGSGEEGAAVSSSMEDRILIRCDNSIEFVPFANIQYVKAAGSYVEIVTSEDTHLVRNSLCTLLDDVLPDYFFRTHRSFVVNLRKVSRLEQHKRSEYRVRMEDGSFLKMSRHRLSELESHLGTIL